MSVHFKGKQFAEEAKELERQLFDEKGNLREQTLANSNEPEPTPDPVTEDAVVAEASTETPVVTEPENKPDPKTVEEDKYKAAVKAMNEAQREAADLRKAQKEAEAKQADLETRLNEVIEARKKEAAQVRYEPEDDLESDLPDVAKIADRKAKAVEARLEARLAEIEKRSMAEETRTKKQAEDSAAMVMRQEVLKAHTDFDEVVNSEAMQTWINTEAPPIYKAIYDGSIPFTSKDVVQVVNHFKSTLVPAKVVADKPNDKTTAKTPVNPTSKADRGAPVTEKELSEFKNQGHRWTPEKRAEFNKRLEAMFS